MRMRTGAMLIVSTLIASSGLAEGLEPAADPPANPRPGFKTLRFDEDWSGFDAAQGEDCWDSIKHIKLNKDGTVWARFGGELRFRGEYWESFAFSPATTADDTFGLGRLVLHGDFHFGHHVRVFVEGKSALSSDRDLPGGKRGLDVDTLAVQNLFFDITTPVGDHADFTARIGRQELLFGKQRLVSPLPWANTKRTWDAARAIVTYKGWRFDGFYSRYAAVQKYEPNDWQPGPNFYGLYATGKIGAKDAPLTLDLYWLALDKKMASFNGTSGAEDRHTVGARLAGKIGTSDFDFDIEGAYQFGDVGSADVSAYMLASQLGWAPSGTAWQPRVYVGCDYASGDGTAGDGDVGTFNQLFPLGHAYHGFMDFIGRQNIVDLSAGVSFKPHKKVTAKADFHFFWRADTADALYNAGGGVVRAGGLGGSSEVGQELDLTVAYQVDGHLTLQGGYSHFFTGDFIAESGPDDDMDWFYLQAMYRF